MTGLDRLRSPPPAPIRPPPPRISPRIRRPHLGRDRPRPDRLDLARDARADRRIAHVGVGRRSPGALPSPSTPCLCMCSSRIACATSIPRSGGRAAARSRKTGCSHSRARRSRSAHSPPRSPRPTAPRNAASACGAHRPGRAHPHLRAGRRHVARRQQRRQKPRLHPRRPLLQPRPRDLHALPPPEPPVPFTTSSSPSRCPQPDGRLPRPFTVRPEPVEVRLRFRNRRRDIGPEPRIDGPLQLHPGARHLGPLAGERLVAGGAQGLEEGGAAGGRLVLVTSRIASMHENKRRPLIYTKVGAVGKHFRPELNRSARCEAALKQARGNVACCQRRATQTDVDVGSYADGRAIPHCRYPADFWRQLTRVDVAEDNGPGRSS